MAQTAGRPAPWTLLFLAAALSACSTLGLGRKGQPLQVSEKDPSAEGTVQTSAGKNGNVRVSIVAKHLAHPERLDPPESTYVVWVQPHGGGGQAQNMGALKVDKDLTGTLQTVVPWKSFDLFITAEPNAQSQQPQGERMLWATVGS